MLLGRRCSTSWPDCFQRPKKSPKRSRRNSRPQPPLPRPASDQGLYSLLPWLDCQAGLNNVLNFLGKVQDSAPMNELTIRVQSLHLSYVSSMACNDMESMKMKNWEEKQTGPLGIFKWNRFLSLSVSTGLWSLLGSKRVGFMIPMQTIFLTRFSGQCAMVLVIARSYLSPCFALPRADSVVLIAERPSLKNYSKSMV